ncbi:hypothetical protein B0H13DRAFT_2659856 [Mycena leptocephala]|nr:hypothetical protein B0H13DRAFT_2659856 [Mycena leptocephala]
MHYCHNHWTWIEIARTRCTHIGSLRFTPHHPDLQRCEGLRASARPDHAATGRGSMPLIIAGPELRKGSAGHFRCSIHALFTPSTSSPRASSLLPPDLLRGWFCTTASFFGRHGPRLIFAHAWYDTAGRGNLLKIGTVLDSDPHVLYPRRIALRICPHALYLRHLPLLAVRLPLPAVGSLPLPWYCDTSSHSLARLTLFNTSTSPVHLLPPAVGALPLPEVLRYLLVARSTLLNTLHLLSAGLPPPAVGSLLPVVLRYLLVVSLGPHSLTPSTFSPRVSSLPPSVLFSRWFCDTSPSSRLLARSTLFNTLHLLSARLLPPAVGPLLLPAVLRHPFLPLLYNMTRYFLPSSSSCCASSLPPSVLFLYQRYHTPLTTRRLPFPRLPPPAAGSPLTCGNATPYPRPFSDTTLLLLPSLLRDSSIPTIPAIPLLGFDSLGAPLYRILRLYYPHALALPHLCIISFPLAFAMASLSFRCFRCFVWSGF